MCETVASNVGKVAGAYPNELCLQPHTNSPSSYKPLGAVYSACWMPLQQRYRVLPDRYASILQIRYHRRHKKISVFSTNYGNIPSLLGKFITRRVLHRSMHVRHVHERSNTRDTLEISSVQATGGAPVHTEQIPKCRG